MHLCNWFDVGPGHLVMSRRLSLVSTQNMKSEQKNEKTKPLSFMFVPCLADCQQSRPGPVLQFIVYSIDSPDSGVADPEPRTARK